MIWKLLLYPVAFIVDRISNEYVMYLWYFIGVRIQHFFLFRLLSRRNEERVSTKILFLSQVFQMFFIRFFASIGGIMILALWGHEYSWGIFLAYLIIRERFIIVSYSIAIPWAKPANLIGAWLGLALVAFLTAMYT